MSNVIKSGFIAFSQDNKLVIDSDVYFAEQNKGKVIRSVDEHSEDIEDLELADILADSGQADAELAEQQAYADVIIRDAEDKANKLMSDAREQANVIMVNAKKDGYDAGYKDGKDVAAREAEQALAELKKQQEAEYQEKLAAFEAEKDAFFADMEPRAAEVIGNLVEALTGIVVQEQDSALLFMINKAMRNIEDSRSFVIRVSSEDYDAVSACKEEIYGFGNPGLSFEIYADAKLTKSQCIIETDNGVVDLSLDEQLKNLKRDIMLLANNQPLA